jgi:C4-dicarboxylate-specific signal transduction histidine kinase
LRSTLAKLASPESMLGEPVAPGIWWRSLRSRFERDGVVFDEFQDLSAVDFAVPATIFDNVAENLLINALNKRREDPGVVIRASLLAADDAGQKPGRVALRIGDSGRAVPAALARKMFSEPLESRSGLGIGLYQAARLAAAGGYRLRLSENRDGAVTFELSPQLDPERT